MRSDPQKNVESLRRSRGLGRALRTLPDAGRAMRRKRLLRRLKPATVKKLVGRSLERRRKWRELRRTRHPRMEKVPVFVVGCNRSGTNMVCRAIGKSPHGWDYPESEFSVAFNGYYLRADWIIEKLIRRAPAPVISFGSILDSQFADDLLSRFEGAKAIWVYRHYDDVVNSCVRMQWAYQLKDFARWVAHGELERLGARGRRVSRDTVRLFNELFSEDLSNEDSAGLYWYMRNNLYFDLSLDADARVLIVQYEDAVLNQENAFRRISHFLGVPFGPAMLEGVSTSSVGKHSRPSMDAAVEEVCSALKARLDEQFARTSAVVPGV